MQDAPCFGTQFVCVSYIYECALLLQSYSSIAGHKETYTNPGFLTEMLLVLS
jgi:hypothetical protein